MKNSKYLIITVVFTLALASLWQKYLDRDMLLSTTHAKTANLQAPDSYMDNITFYQFNEQGKLQQKITSPRAIHFKHHNRLAYEQPHITVYSHSGGDWQIQAAHGMSFEGTHTIEFIHHVVVKRKASKHNPTITATTEHLKAYPRRNTVSTQEPITIKQPHLTITGIGLKGNLTTGELKTLTHTKTTYSPGA